VWELREVDRALAVFVGLGESTRSIPNMVLTAKELTDQDKQQLNGSVAAVFARGSLAGAELVDWLHQLVVA
jgi:hypothetical protein